MKCYNNVIAGNEAMTVTQIRRLLMTNYILKNYACIRNIFLEYSESVSILSLNSTEPSQTGIKVITRDDSNLDRHCLGCSSLAMNSKRIELHIFQYSNIHPSCQILFLLTYIALWIYHIIYGNAFCCKVTADVKFNSFPLW